MMDNALVLHLTGSHFFGMANPDSDIDYIAQDTVDNRSRLLSYGFIQVSKRRFKQGKIDVSLPARLDAHLKARDHIAKSQLLMLLIGDKVIRDAVWLREVIRAARSK